MLIVAVVVSVWYGGTRSGILAAFVGVLGDITVSLLPPNALALIVPHLIHLLIFTVFAAVIITGLTRLRQKERLLNAIVDASPLPIHTIDTAGHVTSWNPAAERLLGWTANEVIGKSVPADPAERGSENYNTVFAKCMDGEALRDIEVQRLSKDGRDIDISLATAPLQGENGQATGAVAIYTDITERKRAEQKLQEGREQLRSIFDGSVIGLGLGDLAGRVLDVNPAFCGMLGYARDELLLKSFQELTYPDDRAAAMGAVIELVSTGCSSTILEKRYLHKNGTVIWSLLSLGLVRDTDGQPLHVISQVQDITERKDAEEALREGRERLRSSFEDSMIGIALSRIDGTFLDANPALCRLLGYDREDLLLTSFRDLTYPDDAVETMEQQPRVVTGEQSSVTIEKRYVHKDGHAIWCLVHASLVRDAQGQPLHFITQIQDISASKEYQDQLRHQAHHDALTGLANRVLLHDRLEQATRLADRNPGPFALLLLDLNGFKRINDTLGHDAGDRLLQEVASRLSASIRKSDTVARLGGDEFAIILPGVDAENARRIAQTIGTSVGLPLTLDGQRISIAASIGIAIYPDHGDDGGTLLRHADLAMYGTKHARGGETPSSSGQELMYPDNVDATALSQVAIEDDEFSAAYQPIVTLNIGCAGHLLALPRWTKPENGFFDPDDSIAQSI